MGPEFVEMYDKPRPPLCPEWAVPETPEAEQRYRRPPYKALDFTDFVLRRINDRVVRISGDLLKAVRGHVPAVTTDAAAVGYACQQFLNHRWASMKDAERQMVGG